MTLQLNPYLNLQLLLQKLKVAYFFQYAFDHKDLSMSTFYELTGMLFFHIIGTRLLKSDRRAFRSIENLTKTTGKTADNI